jgi:hypothetical protein
LLSGERHLRLPEGVLRDADIELRFIITRIFFANFREQIAGLAVFARFVTQATEFEDGRQIISPRFVVEVFDGAFEKFDLRLTVTRQRAFNIIFESPDGRQRRLRNKFVA